VTVRNLGNYSLDLISVPVVLTDHLTGEKKIFIIDALPARGSVNLTFTLNDLKIGTHPISVKVNPDGVIWEKTPANNDKSGSLEVYEGGPGEARGPSVLILAAVVIVFIAVTLTVIAFRPRRR